MPLSDWLANRWIVAHSPSVQEITDSRAGQLMLLDGLTGHESDGHDWNNLLTRWGLLQHDIGIARGMRAVAFVVCVASLIVAVWSALQSRREQPVEAAEL